MGYKNKEQQREYQRKWIAKRRSDWLETNGPCRCGSWDRLEVDHIDPEQKVSHRVWSWSQPRREEELAKCQILCHRTKTVANNEVAHGRDFPNAVMTDELVLWTRMQHEAGCTYTQLSALTGIHKDTLRKSVTTGWKHV